MDYAALQLYHGSSYCITGAADDPSFARCERIGEILARTLDLGQRLIRVEPIRPDEWAEHLDRICLRYGFAGYPRERKDKVIVWNPKTSRLIGGAAEFATEAKSKYGIECDLGWGDIVAIAKENEFLYGKSIERQRQASRIIVAGPPSAGKTEQCRRLSKQLNLVHVNMDDLVKKAIRGRYPQAKELKTCLERGRPLRDEVLAQLLKRRLLELGTRTGWILDNFPQTVTQLHLVEDMDLNMDPHALIVLNCPKHELLNRNPDMATFETRYLHYVNNSDSVYREFTDVLTVVNASAPADVVLTHIRTALGQR